MPVPAALPASVVPAAPRSRNFNPAGAGKVSPAPGVASSTTSSAALTTMNSNQPPHGNRPSTLSSSQPIPTFPSPMADSDYRVHPLPKRPSTSIGYRSDAASEHPRNDNHGSQTHISETPTARDPRFEAAFKVVNGTRHLVLAKSDSTPKSGSAAPLKQAKGKKRKQIVRPAEATQESLPLMISEDSVGSDCAQPRRDANSQSMSAATMTQHSSSSGRNAKEDKVGELPVQVSGINDVHDLESQHLARPAAMNQPQKHVRLADVEEGPAIKSAKVPGQATASQTRAIPTAQKQSTRSEKVSHVSAPSQLDDRPRDKGWTTAPTFNEEKHIDDSGYAPEHPWMDLSGGNQRASSDPAFTPRRAALLESMAATLHAPTLSLGMKSTMEAIDRLPKGPHLAPEDEEEQGAAEHDHEGENEHDANPGWYAQGPLLSEASHRQQPGENASNNAEQDMNGNQEDNSSEFEYDNYELEGHSAADIEDRHTNEHHPASGNNYYSATQRHLSPFDEAVYGYGVGHQTETDNHFDAEPGHQQLEPENNTAHNQEMDGTDGADEDEHDDDDDDDDGDGEGSEMIHQQAVQYGLIVNGNEQDRAEAKEAVQERSDCPCGEYDCPVGNNKAEYDKESLDEWLAQGKEYSLRLPAILTEMMAIMSERVVNVERHIFEPLDAQSEAMKLRQAEIKAGKEQVRAWRSSIFYNGMEKAAITTGATSVSPAS